ncbi:MAG: lysine--tRNA ligase [Candidatus Tectimicrobiota bacterium]
MSETRAQHWADAVAQEIPHTSSAHLISTGITPSGDYHVGHLREVLTAEGVFRALRGQGVACRFNYVADTMDPLRRVYDFLDPALYQAHVGKPLCDVPCPCGQHASYAEHFLAPFLQAMQTLGVRLEVLLAHETYRTGQLDAQIMAALEQTETIKRILHEETGKAEKDDWSPFNALCAACGRLAGTRVTGFDTAARTVSYTCTCGHRATAPVSQAGKLTWRVDWPARWHALGVTIEPFGKDHASRGGSYDTGKRIVREVFGGTPPYPVPYEWIALKGQGDMSSSKGNLVSIFDLAQTIPAEVVRYMIFRVKPTRSISFDPGLPLLNLVDEYDDVTAHNRDPRAAELARLEGMPPVGIPFKHLVNLVQITEGDVDKLCAILQRHKVTLPAPEVLQSRIAYAKYWLQHFSPPEIRLQLHKELPEQVAALTPAQRQALGMLGQRLQPEMDGDAIHTLVYALAEELALPAKALFEAVYIALLDQTRGPRLGWFLSSLEHDFVTTRLHAAAALKG